MSPEHIVLGLMGIFAALGALDRILGSRLGLGKEGASCGKGLWFQTAECGSGGNDDICAVIQTFTISLDYGTQIV